MHSCFARIESMSTGFRPNLSATPMRTVAVLLAICAAGLFEPPTAAAQDSGSIFSIDSLTAVNNGDGTWTASGSVDSVVIDPAGTTVWLSGLFTGHSAVVEEDGSFSCTINLPPYAKGMVLAAVEDPYGAYDFKVIYIF